MRRAISWNTAIRPGLMRPWVIGWAVRVRAMRAGSPDLRRTVCMGFAGRRQRRLGLAETERKEEEQPAQDTRHVGEATGASGPGM